MRKANRLPGLVVAAAMGVLGCTSYSRPVGPPAELTAAQQSFQTLWDASRETLRGYGFEINRQDRRAGTLSTRPLVGQYCLEFWRKDAVTWSARVENSLQTMYRVATVTIRPAPDQAGQYQAEVTVEVARSDLPAVQVTSASEAYGLFTMTGGRSSWLTDFGQPAGAEAADATKVLTQTGPATQPAGFAGNPYWVPLGRDEALEKKIAAEIAAAVRKR